MKRPRKLRKVDNKGMAMVLVIVAIALVTLLVSVLLSVSLLNYQMKVTEKKSKDNFYSAEVALDQIHAGLQQVVSDAIDAAYMNAMQKYGSPIITEPQRVLDFRNTYITSVKGELQVSGDDTMYYVGRPGEAEGDYESTTGLYKAGLLRFLDKELAACVKNGTLVISCQETTGAMTTTIDGVMLKKLRVGYTDPDGYYSEIQTDIRIGFPNIELREAVVLPNVFEYAFIADDGVVFDKAANAKVKDNLYAGPNGVLVQNNSGVDFEDVEYLVSKGNLTIDKSNMSFTGDSMWVKGIDVIGADSMGTRSASRNLLVDGDIYVADDLTVSKYNTSLKLSGNYYGYGGKDGAAQQSAMVLNSANTGLDLTGLEDLMLCGNAYISGKNSIVSGGSDILLGTSLAMKTDQIVFLAPAECLGTKDGVLVGGKNPMTESEYNTWVASAEGYKKLDTSVYTKLLNKPLSVYGITDDSFHTIFRNVGGENICYVFLKFENREYADMYYRDYMQAAKERMNTFLKKYKNDVTVNEASTTMTTAGNLLTYNVGETQMSILQNTIDGSMTEAQKQDLELRQREFGNVYHALCSKLSTNYAGLKTEELSRDVYQNIINETALDALTSVQKYTVGTNQAVFTDNKDGSALEVGSASSNANCKLAVANGNVIVKGNFSGLIIAGGTVTVDQGTGATITADKPAVSKLLQFVIPESGKSVVETYFVDGNKYDLGADASEDKSAYVSLESIIAYVNWHKQ